MRERERGSFDFENNGRVEEDNRVLITEWIVISTCKIIARFTTPGVIITRK